MQGAFDSNVDLMSSSFFRLNLVQLLISDFLMKVGLHSVELSGRWGVIWHLVKLNFGLKVRFHDLRVDLLF